MAQTAEERKIKRLETQIKSLKEKVEQLEEALHWKETTIYSERKWRRDFQQLLKDVVMDDIVEEYQSNY